MLGSIPHWAVAQGSWEKVDEEDGISVYLREAADSRIKELRIELTVDASLDRTIAALEDVEACSEWVYACDEVSILDRLDSERLIYYTRIDFPWPLRDRDAVMKSVNERGADYWQSRSTLLKDHTAPVDDIVRIQSMTIEWRLDMLDELHTRVTYFLKSDPGGIIPAWAINLAIDQGPVRSMKAFRSFLNRY